MEIDSIEGVRFLISLMDEKEVTVPTHVDECWSCGKTTVSDNGGMSFYFTCKDCGVTWLNENPKQGNEITIWQQ